MWICIFIRHLSQILPIRNLPAHVRSTTSLGFNATSNRYLGYQSINIRQETRAAFRISVFDILNEINSLALSPRNSDIVNGSNCTINVSKFNIHIIDILRGFHMLYVAFLTTCQVITVEYLRFENPATSFVDSSAEIQLRGGRQRPRAYQVYTYMV